jgi:hypothetical protein
MLRRLFDFEDHDGFLRIPSLSEGAISCAVLPWKLAGVMQGAIIGSSNCLRGVKVVVIFYTFACTGIGTGCLM